MSNHNQEFAPFQVGRYRYQPVSFMQEGDGETISGHVMRERAKALGALLGPMDGCFLLHHWYQIPDEIRQFTLVFPDWGKKDSAMALTPWDKQRQVFEHLLDDQRWWNRDCLVLRRLPDEEEN